MDPTAFPEGSPVRRALEEGRPDVAEWIARAYPAGGQFYVHSEGTHRACAFGERAREAVRAGEVSAREAERRFGVPRASLGVTWDRHLSTETGP